MLVILPPRSLSNEREAPVMEQEDPSLQDTDFADFSVENFLEILDCDDFFAGINDGDLLSCLEMDTEVSPGFAVPSSAPPFPSKMKDENRSSESSTSSLEVKKKPAVVKSSTKEKRSATPISKNLTVKKKVKVDWTPELHRRFVQAVEQLGVDKAVPSRILELMGIDCLTRHNVASHLQKYRSHRKHLLAKEAEAAKWNQRRQVYGASATGVSGSSMKEHVSPWITPPTIGFPPVPSAPPFRPLHVWGHPSVDQSHMHMWQTNHLSQSPAPVPPTQPTPQQSANPSLWIPHHHVPTQGTPCFSPHLQPPPAVAQRFTTMPVAGIPPPPPAHSFAVPSIHHGQTLPQPPSEAHPSTETIDAAIGDVLSKPWMPLPLGLKPPSLDGVMVELQRQGVSKIPPSLA